MKTLLVALIALALAAPAPAAQIEVTAKQQHTNLARLPPRGRAGDATSARWIIRDRYGQDIGDMLLDCRWVTGSLRLCVGQVSLPLGTIAVIGASRTLFLGQFSVVGGTARYSGASGALWFKQTSVARYVLSIVYQKERT